MPDQTPAPVAKTVRPWWRWLVHLAAGFVVIVILLAILFRLFGYDMVKSYLESPAGARIAGRELGKAIKVDGTFAPLKVEDWTIITDSFTSEGWPGEAIASLNCYNIRAQFDPTAIFHRAWRFSQIDTDHAVINLRKPNDALKRPPLPKKPKPWYAFLLPDHFECGPIVSPNGEVQFSFQGVDSGIRDAHIQADLIGKDLKYTVTSGVLDFPYLPPLRVVRLEMLVTRPAITIYTAQFAALDPADPARLIMSGRMGMREDKSIHADVEVSDMPIEKILPENLRPLLHGKVTGKLTWYRDPSGEDVLSDGDLKLTGAGVNNLSLFTAVAVLNNNPDLNNFNFDEMKVHYHLEHNRLSLELQANSPGKFHIAGIVVYDVKTKLTDLDLAFDQLPLKIWLPGDFKSRYDGMAQATVKWHGQLDTLKDSIGAITVNMDGTHISDPKLLRQLLEKKGFRTPEDIQFDKAQFNFTYADEIFTLTEAQLVAPGVLTARLSGSLAPGAVVNATMDWTGLVVQDWLPEKLAQELSGQLDGHVALAVQHWKFGDGSYGGNIHLLNGELQYTKTQSLLARFLSARELLKIPLTRVQLNWKMDDRDLGVKDIDIRAADAIGVKGDIDSDDLKGLSGLVWVGTKPEYLTWLPGAEDRVFTRKEDGLVWAKVQVSGTLKKPQQDLSKQIIAQLKRHPLAVLGLAGKMVSWYVGDLFGAQKDWQRPATPSVEVGPSAPAKSR